LPPFTRKGPNASNRHLGPFPFHSRTHEPPQGRVCCARLHKEFLNISSPAQVAANQANSKLSTGPVTPEGKAASSQNNFKCGLTCRTFTVRPCESQEDFARYTKTLIDYYKPANIVEDTLVRKMAQHHLCSQRAILAQERCFFEERGVALCIAPERQRELALYLRYQERA
jgi:hypothetical protein